MTEDAPAHDLSTPSGRLRAGPQGYLYLLADHLERPEEVSFEDIATALQGAPSLFAVQAGHPAGQARVRLRAWVDALRAGDVVPWGKLIGGIAVDPVALRQGIGARLQSLSPFAGKALVTLELAYGMTEFGGDASALFSVPLLEAGHELKAGDRYVVALDPAVLKGAVVVQTRKGAS